MPAVAFELDIHEQTFETGVDSEHGVPIAAPLVGMVWAKGQLHDFELDTWRSRQAFHKTTLPGAVLALGMFPLVESWKPVGMVLRDFGFLQSRLGAEQYDASTDTLSNFTNAGGTWRASTRCASARGVLVLPIIEPTSFLNQTFSSRKFDVVVEVFSSIQKFHRLLLRPGVVASKDEVVVAYGQIPDSRGTLFSGAASAYDPKTGVWRTGGTPPVKRVNPSIENVGGSIHFFSGLDGSNPLSRFIGDHFSADTIDGPFVSRRRPDDFWVGILGTFRGSDTTANHVTTHDRSHRTYTDDIFSMAAKAPFTSPFSYRAAGHLA